MAKKEGPIKGLEYIEYLKIAALILLSYFVIKVILTYLD